MSNYFHCEDCGNLFAEEAAKVLWDGDGRVVTNYYACPECRSTAIAECEKCRICGEWVLPGDDYCDECKWDLRKIWESAVMRVMAKNDKDYTENEDLFIEFMQDDMGVI